MPRGKEQKYLSEDVNKWKLEFQISVWAVCKVKSSSACWKHMCFEPAGWIFGLQGRAGGCWHLLLEGQFGSCFSQLVWKCFSHLAGFAKLHLRNINAFLRFPVFVSSLLPPIAVPNGRIALQISKLVSKGCWCSCQYSLLLLPAQGFVCQSSFGEDNPMYSCTAHRKAHGAGAGSGPHFCQIRLLAGVKLHSLASEQCNFFRLKSFYCSAVVVYYNQSEARKLLTRVTIRNMLAKKTPPPPPRNQRSKPQTCIQLPQTENLFRWQKCLYLFRALLDTRGCAGFHLLISLPRLSACQPLLWCQGLVLSCLCRLGMWQPSKPTCKPWQPGVPVGVQKPQVIKEWQKAK